MSNSVANTISLIDRYTVCASTSTATCQQFALHLDRPNPATTGITINTLETHIIIIDTASALVPGSFQISNRYDSIFIEFND